MANNGGDTPGKFLIRAKGDSTDAFILSVVYKGAGTHHNLVRDGEGSEFTINKAPTGCDNFADFLEKYSSKQPKWPVPLVEGVAARKKSQKAPKKVPAKVVAPSDENST